MGARKRLRKYVSYTYTEHTVRVAIFSSCCFENHNYAVLTLLGDLFCAIIWTMQYQPLFAEEPFDNQDMDAYMDYKVKLKCCSSPPPPYNIFEIDILFFCPTPFAAVGLLYTCRSAFFPLGTFVGSLLAGVMHLGCIRVYQLY